MEDSPAAITSELQADDPSTGDDASLTPSVCGLTDQDCVICFSPFDNVFKLPKLLKCGHTFCLECLARMNVSSDNVSSVTCPFCRHLTPLPSGKGLPALDNNQAVLSHLPSGMQTVPSIRFSRDKGKLYTKAPDPGSFLKPVNSISMSLDVGQPATRGLGSRQNMPYRSRWCYYMAIVCVVLLTIALVISGVFIFVIVPSVTGGSSSRPNSTGPSSPP